MSFMNRTKNKLNEMSSDTECKTRVINGRLYADTGRDNIYHVVPLGMDDAKDMKMHPAPEYVVKNNKEYQIVDGKQYMADLRKNGAKTISAKKSGKIVIMDPETETVNGEFTTYTSQGNAEASEKLADDAVLIARADENGKPFVDDFGHTNMWQIKEEKLRTRYADIPEEIRPGMAFDPASVPQDFVQVDKDVAVMCPWGENGRLIPQTVDAGGYLTSASANDCYGIAADEFANTYAVLKDKTVSQNREIPEIPDLENDAEQQFQ